MLYRVGTVREAKTLKDHLPAGVYEKLVTVCSALDRTYGASRNYYTIGGYLAIAETMEDIEAFRTAIIDYTSHPCEWTSTVANTDYLSALFVLNNDYAITLYAPNALLKELLEDSL